MLTTLDIWRRWRLVPSHLEMVVRRLTMVQSWVRSPADHDQEVCAVFGTLCFDTTPLLDAAGTVQKEVAHPWLLQLMTDLEMLKKTEAGAEVQALVGECPLKLFLRPSEGKVSCPGPRRAPRRVPQHFYPPAGRPLRSNFL